MNLRQAFRKKYHKYLLSKEWAALKEKALQQNGGLCCLCKKEGLLEVHHKTYENLFKEKDEDLICVCRDCHRELHGLGSRQKTAIIDKKMILEVLSIKTKYKLKTKSLREVYYTLICHSEKHASKYGEFFITLNQIGRSPTSGIAQIKSLIELGKVVKIENSTILRRGHIKKPCVYRITKTFEQNKESSLDGFIICDKKTRCDHCLYNAACFLLDDQERRALIKGKEWKHLPPCEFNNLKKGVYYDKTNPERR